MNISGMNWNCGRPHVAAKHFSLWRWLGISVALVALSSGANGQSVYTSDADADWTIPTTWFPTGVPTYSIDPLNPTAADIETNVAVTSAVGANSIFINNGSLTVTGTGSVTQVDEIQLHTATLNVATGGTIDPSVPFFAYNGSTLNLGNAVTFSTGHYYVLGSTTIAVDAGTAAIPTTIQDYFTGPDNGGVTKTGAGTLVLTGANTYSLGTTISGGTLVVGNSNALSTGPVVNDATLTTNSVGTGLTVNVGSDFTQGGGGMLALKIFGPTNFDSVALTNAGSVAHVAGTLDVTIDEAVAPGSGRLYHLVTTSNPIDGRFDTLTTNMPDLGAKLYYTTDVILQLPFAIASLTPNQYAVASYIDAHDFSSTNASFNNLVSALTNASGGPGGLGGYFDQLTTINFATFSSSTAFNNTSFLTQQFDDYLANHRNKDGVFVASVGGIDYSALTVSDPNYLPGLQQVHSRLLAWNPAPSSGLLTDSSGMVLGGVDMKEMKAPEKAASDENRWSAFISGNAILAQNFSNPASSESHQDLTTAAMQIGADYRVCPNVIFGAMFGYGHTEGDLDNIGSHATVDTYSPTVYASYANEGWYVNALGSYGFSDYSEYRSVNVGTFRGQSHGDPSGNQIVGNLDGGYDFHRGNWTFGPTSGIQYVHLEVNSFSETGLPGADLSVNDDQTDSLRSRVGGHVSYVFHDAGLTFIPHLSASWQHEFLDQGRGITSQFNDVGAGSFTVNTENPTRDSAIADVGVDAVINQSVTVFVDYALQAGQDNYFGQSVEGGLKIGF